MSRDGALSGASETAVSRAVAVLDLFSIATPLLTVEEVEARLGYTRSTAYRYVRVLVDAGLLVSTTTGAYSLGPRIIELERLAALTDPLYVAGRAVLDAGDTGNTALLLHSLYDDKVLCIYKAGPDALATARGRVVIRRARGVPFPLFRGAASLALLPYLPAYRIRQTWSSHAVAIAAAGLGDDWESYRRTLQAVRRVGHAVSRGQITPGLGGVAVPILLPRGRRLIGSLARTCTLEAMGEANEAAMAERLHALARDIAARYRG